jgi:hypothetical protein
MKKRNECRAEKDGSDVELAEKRLADKRSTTDVLVLIMLFVLLVGVSWISLLV